MDHKNGETRIAAPVFGSDLVPAVIGAENQLIGLGFDGLYIPTDAAIVNAHVRFDANGAIDDGTGSFGSADFADIAGDFEVLDADILGDIATAGVAANLKAAIDGDATDAPPAALVWIERLDLDPIGRPSQSFARPADPTGLFDPGASAIDRSSEAAPAVDPPAPQTAAGGGDIQVTTTGSDAPIVTFGEIALAADGDAVAPLSSKSMPLINIDGFLGDGRFAGIDGSGFAAVILDTGIDLDHPFFGPDDDLDGIADRIVFQYDFADGDGDASDQSGHGSNVSSIIASSDSVYAGVAPGVDIIHLKVFADSGAGSFSYVEQALQWVVDNSVSYNIASVNMSLGDGGNYGSAQSLYGIADEIAALASLDVITVSASGNKFYQVNSLQGVQYPAADPNSLSVGAVYDSSKSGFSYGDGAKAFSTDPDTITPFSQRDADLTDIFAPGAPITGAGADGGLVTMHGTSQASPHIAGVAVLAQQMATQMLGRRLTVSEFSDLLVATGVTINDGDDEDDNVTNTGLDFSRVDVLALGDAIFSMVEPTVYYGIAATDTVLAEGDGDTTPFEFTVTRTGDISVSSEVDFAVTGSGAEAADVVDFGGALPSGTLSFAAGQASKVLTIGVSGDLKAEADEGFTVTLSMPSLGSAITTAAASATIANDDEPATVVEVRVSASADDAEEKASGSVSLTSSDLELIDDRGAQTVGIRFAGIDVPRGAVIVDAYLQFQVDEKDSGATTLEIRGEAADDAATFSASSFDITSRSVTSATAEWSPPAWSTTGEQGSAQQTSDLTAVVQEIVDRGGWQASNAMAFVIDGAGKRVAESFDGKAAAAPLLHIEYQDAPAAPDPTTFHAIVATDAALPEGDGDTTPFTFTVTRSGDTSAASEIGYTVTGSGADAANAGDFAGALPAGMLSFAAGQTSQVLTVEVSGDSDVEADEGFTVTLSNPSDGGITTASAEGTIRNDDSPPAPPPPTTHSITITDAEKPEGDTGATPFVFTVTRSGDTSVSSEVSYAVTGSGADAADFGGALPSGTLSFAADEISKDLTIEVFGDTDVEADEGFTVTLSPLSPGSEIATASASATITNDDEAPAEPPAPPAPPAPTVFEVRVAASSDDAEEKASGSVSLTSSDLELVEDRSAQTVGIRFAGIDVPRGAVIVDAYLQFQVDEKDSGATTLEIRGEAADDAATFSASAFGITSRSVTSATAEWSPPAWSTTGEQGSAQQTSDLTAVVQEIVDRGGWQASNAMAFVIDGAGKRVAESFDGKAAAAPLLHIEYQDAPATPDPTTFHAIAAADAENPEGNSDTTPFTFTVTRSGDVSGTTDVAYAVTGSGADAADGEDFGGALPSGTLSFISGETSKTLTIEVSGDGDVETDEGFTVTLSSPSPSSAITAASAEGTIANDDTELAIAATDAVKPEGDTGATPFTFTVTRSGDVSGTTDVAYAVTGSGADAADFGAALPSGTLSFAAGETSKILTVEVLGDGDVEADEGFTVTLSNPTDGAGITTASAEGTIRNDDSPPAPPSPTTHSIAVTDAEKPEGDTGATPFAFTVTRSGDTSVSSEVTYAVTGSATDAADFGGALPSGTLSFAADEISKDLTIEVSGDTDVEADEGFTVTLSSPSPGSEIATASASATITNDDEAPAEPPAPPAPPAPTVFEVRVSASSDDAEEKASGSVSLSSSDLELVEDRSAQTVGIRFAGIDVPRGAVIVDAYLQFQVDEKDSGATTLEIRGEAADDAATFSASAFGITSRSVTSATAEWSPPAWSTVGAQGSAQQTSDLTAVVQEIVDRGGWQASNAMAFVINGAGKRVAESFDGKAAAAPLLHIEYQDAPAAPDPTTFHAIAAADAALPEGDGDTTPFAFTVTRSGDISASSEIGYAVTGSGADAADGEDFGGALPSGTVRFAAGEISKALTIEVSGDGDVETDEGFTVTLSSPSPSSAITTASAEGTIANDDEAPPAPPGPTVVEVRVSAGSDDAEEKASGSMSLSSSDLELISDGGAQTVGIRFAGVDVPRGAVIIDAYLWFQVDEKDSGATTLEIRGESADDAVTFSIDAFDITSRSVTSASATWSPPAWSILGEHGPAQQTSDLSAVVQEIVDHDGWSAANAMAFVISGAGKRVAESFDGKAAAAPLLHIEYESAELTDIDLFF